MRGMWARIGQAKGVIGGVAITVVVVAIIVTLMAARGGAHSSQSHAGTAQATSAATLTTTATDTPAPSPTATYTPIPTATPVLPFAGTVIRVVQTVPWLTGTVSVSCPAGTNLIGGGVDTGYGTSDFSGVLSSYPSSANTWTVIGPMSNVSYNLSAVADCLHSATPIQTRVLQSTSPTSSYMTGGGPVDLYDLSCPSGVVTGGGYDVNTGGFVVDSRPDKANGWVSSAFRNGLTAYVICASASIHERIAIQAVTYPLYPGSGPSLVVQTTLSCPSGYTPFSGGFGEPQSSEVQVGWGSNELATSGKQWIVTGALKSGVPNTNAGDVYALCALLS